jgi:hypothetical protein
MQPAGTNLARFPSKLLLTVILGLVASGLAASVLYAVHVSRAPSSSEFLTDLAPQGDGLSAEERRGLTREMLKARRENPQEPAEVRPTPASRPADSGPAANPADDGRAGDPKGAGNPADDGKAADPKGAGNPADDGKAADPNRAVKAATDRASPDRASPDRAPPDRAAPLPIARPAAPRARAEAPVVPTPAGPPAATAASSAPSPGGTPPAATDPALQATATPNASSVAEPAPEAPRGFANNVFSSLSSLAGSAANATGNTVNWMIDLPGKAISAGGRLFAGDSPASTQPTGPAPSAGGAPSSATLPPPATAPPPTAPPPRRNL